MKALRMSASILSSLTGVASGILGSFFTFTLTTKLMELESVNFNISFFILALFMAFSIIAVIYGFFMMVAPTYMLKDNKKFIKGYLVAEMVYLELVIIGLIAYIILISNNNMPTDIAWSGIISFAFIGAVYIPFHIVIIALLIVYLKKSKMLNSREIKKAE